MKYCDNAFIYWVIYGNFALSSPLSSYSTQYSFMLMECTETNVCVTQKGNFLFW